MSEYRNTLIPVSEIELVMILDGLTVWEVQQNSFLEEECGEVLGESFKPLLEASINRVEKLRSRLVDIYDEMQNHKK